MAVLNDKKGGMPERKKAMTKPKTTEEDVLKLAEEAASYTRGGDVLIKSIQKIECVLIEIFEYYSQFRFIDGCVGYVNNLLDSKVGSYGGALCYVSQVNRRMVLKPLPPTWSTAGSGSYLHGDFRAWYNRATRAEIAMVAAHLRTFLEALAAFMRKSADENEATAIDIEGIAVILAGALSLKFAPGDGEAELHKTYQIEIGNCTECQKPVFANVARIDFFGRGKDPTRHEVIEIEGDCGTEGHPRGKTVFTWTEMDLLAL